MSYSSSFVLIIFNVYLIVWSLGSDIPTIILVSVGSSWPVILMSQGYTLFILLSVEFYTNPYLISLSFWSILPSKNFQHEKITSL